MTLANDKVLRLEPLDPWLDFFPAGWRRYASIGLAH
jgi:hypothetical protein